MTRTPLIALLLLAPLAACASAADAVRGPQLSQINYPAPDVQVRDRTLLNRDESARPASANSLWRNGSRAFFHDQRASRVGDILTVSIDINDNAKLANQTATNRTTSVDGGVTNFLGLTGTLSKVLPGAVDTGHLVTSGSTSKMAGQGSVNRSEAVSLTIAAVISGVMPNGNLVIQGRQEVRINQELRELSIAGIVRPEDITAANTIRHTQIAEARVSYGGRGSVSRAQKTPAGQALVETFTPF